MTVRSILSPLTAVVLATVFVIPAFAESKTGTNRDEQAAANRGAVGAHALAYQLYDYGQRAKNALAVLAAASLIAGSPATDTKRDKTVSGSPKEGDTTEVAPPQKVDMAAMLVTARELAGKNETLLAMIEELEASRSKGLIGSPRGLTSGPVKHRDIVKAGTVDYYDLVFRGRELPEIGVKGGAPLGMHVLDENGNKVCEDIGKDTLYCDWTPRWTGPFRLRLTGGDHSVEYILLTN